MSAAEDYLRSVYHDRLHEEWKRFSELDPATKAAVLKHLRALPDIAWSSLASPADQFFVMDDERLPMSVFERMARGE